MSNQNVIFYFLMVLLVIAVISTVFVVGIYQAGWDNTASRLFVGIVPLPVAVVDGRGVRFSELYDRLEAYQQLVEFQSSFDFDTPQGQIELTLQRQSVLERLVEDEIVIGEIRRRGIFVSDASFSQYYRYLLNRFGVSEENAAQEIQRMFGWSLAQFQNSLVLPDLFRAEFQIALLKEARDGLINEQIELVRDKLRAGEDFAEVARNFSEDHESAFIGGDKGYIPFLQLGPWLADSVFNLEVGEISEVVISPAGYHILQINDKDAGVDPGVVQFSQILIKGPSVEDFLRQAMQQADVYVFEKL